MWHIQTCKSHHSFLRYVIVTWQTAWDSSFKNPCFTPRAALTDIDQASLKLISPRITSYANAMSESMSRAKQAWSCQLTSVRGSWNSVFKATRLWCHHLTLVLEVSLVCITWNCVSHREIQNRSSLSQTILTPMAACQAAVKIQPFTILTILPAVHSSWLSGRLLSTLIKLY